MLLYRYKNYEKEASATDIKRDSVLHAESISSPRQNKSNLEAIFQNNVDFIRYN